MTATATRNTIAYVKEKLAMDRPELIEVNINKKNIRYCNWVGGFVDLAHIIIVSLEAEMQSTIRAYHTEL